VGVDLGEAGPIDDLVARLRQALADPESEDADALGRQLQARIEAPLARHLTTAKRLLLAPDRELNLVPFAVLQDDRYRRLVERFALSYVTSGREILSWRRLARSVPGPALLLAAPDFDAAPEAPHPEDTAQSDGATRVARRLRGGVLPWPFMSLPGTLDEARAVGQLVPGMQVLTGAQASKAALGTVRSPAIVHIATHGFYMDAPPGRSEPRPEEALLRSGLALAGANRRDDAAADGVLTALELAALDLRGTQLAVLSACETGLGEVHRGEGVYGLRRALVMAGVRSQLVSLWKVDDESTRGLMSRYYRNLMRRQDRVEALRQVQLALMRRPPPFNHPYYWAGFIAAGAWGPLDLPPASPND
jgi:CHAT domain-containing protein